MVVFSSQLLTEKIGQFELLQRASAAADAQLWLVGGCVRDLLCQRTPLDIDLASDKPEMLASHFAVLSNGRLVILDAEHSCWRVVCKNGKYFDISALRAATIIDDLMLRDFTINSIAIPILPSAENYILLDPMDGEIDLRQQRLRLTSASAINDDPARIIRAYRLCAEFNLAIEEETSLILQQSAPLIPGVAPERLLQEWWKICASNGAVAAIKQLADHGILFVLFPELCAADCCLINNQQKTLWSHSMLTMENVAALMQADNNEYFPDFFKSKHRRARLLYISLIHDIGKIICQTVDEDGAINFPGHNISGAKMAQTIAKHLRMSRADSDVISKVIKLHLRPLQLARLFVQNKLSMNAIVRFFDDAGEQLPELFLLALADSISKGDKPANTQSSMMLTILYDHLMKIYWQQYQPAVLNPVINGHQLIENLQLHPGKKMGQLLWQIRLRQIIGEITTTAQALEFAREKMD